MIKKIFLTLLISILVNQNVFAVTLSEALLQAYISNPELNAERENIQVSKEDLNISRSEFLPVVTLSGSQSEENTKKLTDRTGTNSSYTDVSTKTQSIKIEQKLFQGFAGIASIEKSKIGLSLADAKLLKAEQKILYEAIEAYLGLIFASLGGYDIRESVNLWKRMSEANKGKEPPQFLSTHPSSLNRIDKLKGWMNEIMIKYPPLKV